MSYDAFAVYKQQFLLMIKRTWKSQQIKKTWEGWSPALNEVMSSHATLEHDNTDVNKRGGVRNEWFK